MFWDLSINFILKFSCVIFYFCKDNTWIYIKLSGKKYLNNSQALTFTLVSETLTPPSCQKRSYLYINSPITE